MLEHAGGSTNEKSISIDGKKRIQWLMLKKMKSTWRHKMQEEKKNLLLRLIWPALMLFLLASILFAADRYFNIDENPLSNIEVDPIFLVSAFAFQTLAIAMVIVSWRMNLVSQGVREFGVLQIVAMVGVSSIGKYAPGKLMGLFARGALVNQHGGRAMPALVSALIEQTALVHSALILIMAGYSAFLYNWTFGALVVLVLLPTIWWVARRDDFLTWAVQRMQRFKDAQVSGFEASYPLVCFGLLIMWPLAGVVIWMLMLSLGVEDVPPLSILLVASTTSYLGGFLAFFAPAGIGVREGLLVAILAPFVGVATAIYISILHRIVTVLIDIVLGAIAFAVMATRQGRKS